MVSLLVCLIPTTIGALLSAIGIAGMDRLVQRNVLAMSGRAVEAAGDVNTLLLDKTGTITLGNRQAADFIPRRRCPPSELADAAQLSSLADETPEGRSIVVLAKTAATACAPARPASSPTHWVPVHRARPGCPVSTCDGRPAAAQGRGQLGRRLGPRPRRRVPAELGDDRRRHLGRRRHAARRRRRPRRRRTAAVLGVIHLKDIVKQGMRDASTRCARWASAPS